MGAVHSGTWLDSAWVAIDRAHATLPVNVSFMERQRTIDAAYPFGLRRHFPYKMWLKARKQYLARYRAKTAGPLFAALPKDPAP